MMLMHHSTHSTIADTPRAELRLRVDEFHPDLDALLCEHGTEQWAYITAWNPASEPLAEEENQTRQSKLEQELSAAGYSLFQGEGKPDEDDWDPEQSVLVAGISRQEAVRYGVKYGQNAIVCGRIGEAAELVWCDA
jgi:hypothetical protein